MLDKAAPLLEGADNDVKIQALSNMGFVYLKTERLDKAIDILNNGKSFNEIFGVPKSYYNMMKKNNIDQYELVALQLYNTDNYNIVYFLSTLTRRFDYSNCKSIERDKKKFKWFFYLFKKDMEKLYEYTKNQKKDMAQ